MSSLEPSMPPPLPANPFPTVSLSAADRNVIVDSVELLLHDALAQYEAHLVESKGVVPERIWKLVKSQDGVTVYRKRKTPRRASDSTKVHTILAVGTLPGSVDDLLYGCVNPRGELASAYSHYIFKNTVSGQATLASIVAPSRKDPARSVAIKWDAHGAAAPFNKVFDTRDFVAAEATGSTINSLGERIAYFMLHSIDVAGAPELAEHRIIRATKFFTFLYRQMSPDRVDIYMMGRIDTRGKIPTGLAARASAEGLVRIILRTKQFSDMKKRTWLFRHFQAMASIPFSGATPPPGGCAVCSKSLASMLHPSRTCVVCRRQVCGSCAAMHKVLSSDGATASKRATMRPVPFCSHCLARAHQLNAWELAVAETAAVLEAAEASEEGSQASTFASLT